MNYVDLPTKMPKDKSADFNVKNETAVKNSISNILSTRPGEVPGHPQFGCNLGKFLFELINPLTAELIKEEIKYSLTMWEPRIIIKDIFVHEDHDYNRLNIKIVFNIKKDITSQDIDYIYTLTR